MFDEDDGEKRYKREHHRRSKIIERQMKLGLGFPLHELHVSEVGFD